MMSSNNNEDPLILSPQHTIDYRSDTEDQYIYLDDDELSIDEEDEGDENEEIKQFNPKSTSNQSISRKLTRTDAESIVGGESFKNFIKESQESLTSHPVADPNLTTEQQEIKVDANDLDINNYNSSQKVFSFSLPFGGLESIRSNLARQLHNLKFDSLPFGNHHDNDKELEENIRLQLSKQETINTIDEANYFKNFQGTDNGRLRAVKHSLSTNLNEIIPHKKKDFIKPYESIYERIEGNIVIMGGYRGSILRDSKTHKRVWIPIKAGFNLRKINLLLGPNQIDELNAQDKIYADGVLKNIGPIDICKKLIKKLEANPKVNLKEFGYDWRLSGNVVSKQLEIFLSKIYEETGKPTLVIAHSMGGLMVHGTLQRNPKLFRSIVYVGSPSECLNILGPIRFGDSVLLSDKILTFEANFMMRSSFIFLPLSGRVFYNKETKEHYDIDFFDPNNWVEYNLNPLVSSKRKQLEESKSFSNSLNSVSTFSSLSTKFNKIYRSAPIIRSRSTSPMTREFNLDEEEGKFSYSFADSFRYLSETLKSTKEYVLSLEYDTNLESEYPPMAIVYGNKIPSVRGSVVRSRQDIKDGNYYEFFYGHGDGVIHQKWLMPERKGFNHFNAIDGTGQIVGKFASESAHVTLMTDFDTMGKALDAVFEAEKNWKTVKSKFRN
ncbi:unnamed protein product [Candida verbasci]|uniref:Uncharacterized protein n=1 Tax=Candida verbasci TaxID=1227364 RepID=A0A9W4XBG6_9ASCO|nr:unnamed protein product [Candida verbasci]